MPDLRSRFSLDGPHLPLCVYLGRLQGLSELSNSSSTLIPLCRHSGLLGLFCGPGSPFSFDFMVTRLLLQLRCEPIPLYTECIGVSGLRLCGLQPAGKQPLHGQLALLDLLYKEEKPPLILDECFAYIDAPRTERLMKLLRALAAEGVQSVVLACHSREGDIAERVGSVTRLRLSK